METRGGKSWGEEDQIPIPEVLEAMGLDFKLKDLGRVFGLEGEELDQHIRYKCGSEAMANALIKAGYLKKGRSAWDTCCLLKEILHGVKEMPAKEKIEEQPVSEEEFALLLAVV